MIDADGARLRSLPFAQALDDRDVRQGRRARGREPLPDRLGPAGGRPCALARYRFALEHLFIAVPGPEAVAAERTLAMLAARRPLLDPLLPPEAAFRCGLVPGEDLAVPLAPVRPLVVKN